jgi:hypothetical protein
MWKIADLVNWPVQGRRQWLQRRCQSEIDIAGIVQQTSGCLLLPWHSEPERIKRSQHSASEDQPHDFVAGRGSMQCRVFAHHNNRPLAEHVEEVA